MLTVECIIDLKDYSFLDFYTAQCVVLSLWYAISNAFGDRTSQYNQSVALLIGQHEHFDL